MTTDQREVLREYVNRKHGPIHPDTFDAIFAGAQLLASKGSPASNQDLRDVVDRNCKPGKSPATESFRSWRR